MKPIFLAVLATLAAHAAPAPGFARAPYLQLATDHSMSIVWRAHGEIDPVVMIGPSMDALTAKLPASQIITRTHPSLGGEHPLFTDVPVATRQYEATITGLKPATTYFYAIYDGTKRLTPADDSYHFTTHPEPGKPAPLYFWVVGDSGTGGNAQAAVHAAMVEHTGRKGHPIDLYLHVGDMAYDSGTDREFSDRFFRMYEPTLRNTVCWAAMGNHEGKTSKGATGTGPFYDAYLCPTRGEAGGLPSGKEAFYSFDYGTTHFICLDSHDLDRRPTGEMAQWLKADLEKTKAEFLVAFFHHPPYTKGSHDSDREEQLIEMREHIMPILESGGVDLVFTGHSHIYERSMLIDGAYQTPSVAQGVILDDGDGDPAGDGSYRKSAGLQPRNGSVSIVAGHGGTTNSRSGSHPLMKRIIVDHGSCLITIDSDTILGEMLDSKGTVRDTFAIRKSGTVRHTPVPNPWQPEPFEKEKKPQAPHPPTPPDATVLVAKQASWFYLAGSHPAGEATAWAAPGYDVSAWKTGEAGFGYSDNDDNTVLDMRGKYQTLYLRHEFFLPDKANLEALALAISYDDAFIAYLNGHEILRQGVNQGHGASADGFTNHEANGSFEHFPLRNLGKILKPGQQNILAIEGHNANLDSSDYTLHPTLLLRK